MKRTIQLLSPLLFVFAPGCSQGQGGPELPPILEADTEQQLAFGDPNDCASCHENHVREWEISNHAYAMVDPVFHAMVEVGQKQSEGKLGQFCVQCHSPVGLATGQTPVAFDENIEAFVQKTEGLGPIASRGVSCDVCHSVTDILEPHNARGVLTPNGVRRATIKDPVPTPAHASEYSPLHESSDMCSMCHNVTNPRGALIEETYTEWQVSSAAKDGKQCQDCHMPAYRGKAAPDGPERELHRHTFVGVDVPLVERGEFPGYDEMRDLTREMLKSSATMAATFDSESRAVSVEIENLAGHCLPSGAVAERQLWVEARVFDAAGKVVFESGTLDENGDVRDGVASHSLAPGTDPQLIYFGQLLVFVPDLGPINGVGRDNRLRAAETACRPLGRGGVDPASGIKPVLFPWQANWQCNYMIEPDATGGGSYDLAGLAAGEYRVELKLLFRAFPPYFLRELEKLAGLDPAVKGRVPLVEIDTVTLEFSIPERTDG